MLQLLLRTFLVERRPRDVPELPAYRQALAALPLRLLQQAGADAPLVELLNPGIGDEDILSLSEQLGDVLQGDL